MILLYIYWVKIKYDRGYTGCLKKGKIISYQLGDVLFFGNHYVNLFLL